jgi:hypothetical protein
MDTGSRDESASNQIMEPGFPDDITSGKALIVGGACQRLHVTAGKPEKSSPIPCYFGRLRLKRRHVSRPPHPWRLAGDVQWAAIAAFNFLKSKD